MLRKQTTYDAELDEDLQEVLDNYPHMAFTDIEVKGGEVHCQYGFEAKENIFEMIRDSIRRRTNFIVVDSTEDTLYHGRVEVVGSVIKERRY